MQTGQGRLVINWGHLAFLAFVSAVVIFYLIDAREVSLRTNNLLLVQPAVILALILVACVLPQCFKRRTEADLEVKAAELEALDMTAGDLAAVRRRELLKVASLAILLGVFAFFLETIGFDVATFLFMAIGLWICGERRLWLIAVFSAAFTAFIIYGYSMLVPYPFPLRIL